MGECRAACGGEKAARPGNARPGHLREGGVRMAWMIIYTVVCVLCLAWLAWMFERAPEGWEDDDGFHAGRKT